MDRQEMLQHIRSSELSDKERNLAVRKLVDCPRCAAKAGFLCVSPNGNDQSVPHSVRIKAFLELKEGE